MVKVYIQLLEDVEENLGSEDVSLEKLKEYGDNIKKKFDKIVSILTKLESKGWKWTTGPKNIYLVKDVSEETAMTELKEAGLDEDMINFN